MASVAQQGKHVGEVVLALGIVIRQSRQGGRERTGIERIGPGVDLADRELLGAGVADRFRLDHALDAPVGAAYDSPVAARIVELDSHHRRGGA
jgi:hypothetical protein